MRSHSPPRVGLIAALAAGLVVAAMSPATAARTAVAKPWAATAASPAMPSTAADPRGRVRGEIRAPRSQTARVTVTWFTTDYRRLGQRNATGGYSLNLPAGTYRLQFTDRRPTYDVNRYQPSNAKVVVRAGGTTTRSVRMKPGAAIGGQVRAGRRPARGARIVLAAADQRTFSTTADARGRYAIGGLPGLSYSVFTYDRTGARVARSTYLRRLSPGSYRTVSPRLSTRAGILLVDLRVGPEPYRGPPASVTAVSRSTGQFWTARSRRGTVTFEGLYPGRYRLEVPALGGYLGATVTPGAKVRSSRTTLTTARLTQRGASVVGRVVDANHAGEGPDEPAVGLGGAQVQLLASSRDVLASATTGVDGSFILSGALRTQTGLRVRARPDPESGTAYLGEGTSYCKYGPVISERFAVTTGRARHVGQIRLPHLPNPDQVGPQCHTTPRSTP